MAEPIPIREAETEPAPNIVEAVERLLKDVRSGDVRELVYAARRRGNEIQTASVGDTDNLFGMLGGIEYLKHRLLQGVD